MGTQFFESYDNKINPERYSFTESIFKLFGGVMVNNPTSVVDTSFFSNQKMVTTYQYQYDKDGYPTNKITQVILDGSPLNSFNQQYEYYQ